MSESLTRRVGRLIAGSFNALVDAVENTAPQNVMEQALREIDNAISEVRKDLGAVEAQRHLAARRLSEVSDRHEELGEQARLALKSSRDDLAAAAIERQMDLEAQIPILESRLSELAEEKIRLEGYINALQAKKREMREALEAFRRSQRGMQGRDAGDDGEGDKLSSSQQADYASEAFDRVFQRNTGLKGTRPSSNDEATRLAELEELSRRNRVQERLARLKADNP